ncbi:unnamed protein product [Periconia digitata]|uniref:Copper-fist domain-containing protein n=1 Tax=Periconia digitata TaxID=1303443 RepID=A0A9W4UAT1_9PLEO|nr:unnamed protein product [Periconia digitata]
MWAEVNGERKKVACGPCIRGHRSSKCDHRDRVLVEVRKPGRPLSSCPHPTGSCSCERVVINYTIPKSSECACPSERAQPAAPSTAGGRVQKQRLRKSVTNFNTAVLERAIKANQDGETDSSSILTRTPTSETNSAPSSASSTPRLQPSRKASQSGDISTSQPATTPTVSSCCQPKPVQQILPPQTGGCCGSKAQEVPKAIQQPAKSCCGGAKPTPQMHPQYPAQDPTTMNPFTNYPPPFPPQHHHQHFQSPPYNMLSQNPSANSFVPMPPPFNFNTPIYNHIGSMFSPQPSSLPMSPQPLLSSNTQPPVDHNCHCGDSCSCFGCAAHPNNATMMEYIRSMHQYMSTGHFTSGLPPTYDLPAYAQHNAYPPPQNYASPATAHQISFAPQAQTIGSVPGTPLTGIQPGPWGHQPQHHHQQDLVSTPLSTLDTSSTSHYFSTATPNTSTHDTPITTTTSIPPPTLLKQEQPLHSPTLANSPASSTNLHSDNTPQESADVTLSPSSYFWNEVVLPGCNDATGTCQCGDGCECVGCLTHGGHNGVALLDSVGDAGFEGFGHVDVDVDVDVDVGAGAGAGSAEVVGGADAHGVVPVGT